MPPRSFSTGIDAPRSVRGGSRGRHFDQAIFKTVVNPSLLCVAAVPAVGFLESGVKRSRLEPEDALRFHYYLRDRRHVQIDAEVGGLSHGIAASFGDAVARHTHDVRLLTGSRGHGQRQLELRPPPLASHT